MGGGVKSHTPGQGKLLCKVLEVVEECFGDIVVDGIVKKAEIAREHHRFTKLAGDKWVRVRGVGIYSFPLWRIIGTLNKGPVVVEQRKEELYYNRCQYKLSVQLICSARNVGLTIGPLGRGLGPNNLKTTRVTVVTHTSVKAIFPPETLILNSRSVGLRPDEFS